MNYKKQAKLVKADLHITFVYNAGLVTKVKTLSGRKWHPAQRMWSCPPSFENLDKLTEWDFELDKTAQRVWDDMNEQTQIDLDNHPALEGAYPFQKRGVEFLEAMNGKALISDEMGLGKTVQALLYLKLHPELRPAVIVCPASLKLNWEKEIRTWLDCKCTIVSGNYSGTPPTFAPILIINYDILDSWIEWLLTIKPDVMILDEAHYIKNRTKIYDYKTDPKTGEFLKDEYGKKIKIRGSGRYKTARVQAVMDLAKNIPHIIPLTGTPIENRPEEFWNLLKLVDPIEWGSEWNFLQTYCGKKHNGFGWDFSGASNIEKLHKKAQRCMIRRLKSEVLPDLPAKIRTVIPLEITNRKAYNQAVDELDSSDSPAIQLTRIEALKQLVVEGKIKACIDWIKDFLESGEKLVVFCTHHLVVDILMKELEAYDPVSIDGRTPINHRQSAVDNFQNYSCHKIFIGNIKAAGVGLTLTAASSTCFIELGWTPGEHQQAEDRVHRIGQEADSVNAYYLLGQDTIETEIAELLDEKRKVLDSVLDGKETEETSLLTELINRLIGE